MRVVIAGGHGKIALLLERLLAERGDQAVGLIRNRAHVADVQGAGAEAVICDLEAASAGDVAVLLSGADAVVFAAGAAAGSGAPRKDSVDRAGSVLMACAAGRAWAAGSCRSPRWESARRRGSAVMRSGLPTSRRRPPLRPICAPETWTGPSCARVASLMLLPPARSGSRPAGPGWQVPRADVAAVIAALLDDPGTWHQTLELTGGHSPVAAAVRSIS